ncbi:MFS transporter [Streptomyces sp. SID9727]|uniref:MFS transporter n=1 Tax=Streptomyces sp. SID9727 TaxID=2706114 RepID=UPI0013C96908|nr:MFS transporter [Streptomyces sp. SID9727]NEC65562.1 MFS transporter [Streptomyces sp. SID9727]
MRSRTPRRQPDRGSGRLWHNKDFTLLWIGQSLSFFGGGLYDVAVAWSVYAVTRSSAATGIVVAATTAAQFLCAVPSGYLSDRMSRRRMLIVSDLLAGAAALAVGLAALRDSLSLAPVVLLSLVLGACRALGTIAHMPLLAQTARGDVKTANFLHSITYNSIRITSVALGGLLLTITEAHWLILANAVSFFGAALVTQRIGAQQDEGAATGPGAPWQACREGLRVLLEIRSARLIVLSSALAKAVYSSALAVTLPRLMTESAGTSGSLGLAMGLQSLGVVAGSWMLRRVTGGELGLMHFRRLVTVGATAILALTWTSGPLLLLCVFVAGCGLAFEMIEQTCLQQIIPARVLGRVLSLDMFAGLLCYSLGSALLGGLVDLSGAPLVLTCCAAAQFALVLALRHGSRHEPGAV